MCMCNCPVCSGEAYDPKYDLTNEDIMDMEQSRVVMEENGDMFIESEEFELPF